MAEDNGKRTSPPYVGYVLFKNFLGELAATTIPTRIDPSMMVGKSGGTIASLRVALSFFGLTQGDGTVTETLRALVRHHGTDRWSPHLQHLVQNCYAPILEGVPLDNGTSAQLAEAFAKHAASLSSATRSKAISFYLKAAKDAGIELSTHFKPPRVRKSQNNGRKKTAEETPTGEIRRGIRIDPVEGMIVQTFAIPGRKDPIEVSFPVDLKPGEWDMVAGFMHSFINLRTEGGDK